MDSSKLTVTKSLLKILIFIKMVYYIWPNNWLHIYISRLNNDKYLKRGFIFLNIKCRSLWSNSDNLINKWWQTFFFQTSNTTFERERIDQRKFNLNKCIFIYITNLIDNLRGAYIHIYKNLWYPKNFYYNFIFSLWST